MSDKAASTPSLRSYRGRLTFDVEVSEGGKDHSRTPHVPSPSAGVTIGRGYDMGSKNSGQITADLVAAGVDLTMAQKLSGGAMLRGENAKKFIKDKELDTFEISERIRDKLFEATYAAEERSARGVCERANAKYGACDWDELHPAIQELIIDLKYHGDYTPKSRELIQEMIVANDLESLTEAMADQSNWKGVPAHRFARRKAFMESALKESA